MEWTVLHSLLLIIVPATRYLLVIGKVVNKFVVCSLSFYKISFMQMWTCMLYLVRYRVYCFIKICPFISVISFADFI